MGRKLYQYPLSTPCLTVRLVGNYLGLDFEMITINPLEGETRTEEFMKISPQHTIPVLIDEDGFVVRESRTICRYLAQKYGNHSLYPQDLKTRTEVDMMLDFDATTLSKHFTAYLMAIYKTGSAEEEIQNKLTEALSVLDCSLEINESGWVAAGQFTIADVALLTSVQILQDMGYDFSKYPNILKWTQTVSEQIPEYETVVTQTSDGLQQLLQSRKQEENENEQ